MNHHPSNAPTANPKPRYLLRSAVAAVAVSVLLACGGGGDSSNVASPASVVGSQEIETARAAPASAQVFNLSYKDAPLDNPLKGFLPYQPWFDRNNPNDDPTQRDVYKNVIPHSMEWFYVPLKDIQKDYNTFDWTEVEKNLKQIKGRGRQAALRIYIDYPGNDYGLPDFLAHVPKYAYSDYGNKKSFSPDYTHPDLQRAVLSFIAAFGKQYDNDARVGFVTAGLLGFWGEWHTYAPDSSVGDIPPQLMQDVLEAYNSAFANKMIHARGPAGGVDMKKYTRLGFHDDSFALSTVNVTSNPSLNWYFWPKMQGAGLQDNWKTEPMGGEVYPGIQGCIWNNSCSKGQSFDVAVATTHASWLINHGAFTGGYTGDKLQQTLKQHHSLGYTLHVPKASLEPAQTGQALRGTVSIENRGVAPFYYPWAVQLAAVDTTGKLKTWTMGWDLRTVLPGAPSTWAFDIPNHGLAAGNYTLMMSVPNPMEGGRALRFANTTQDQNRADWLSVGAFTVGDGSGPVNASDITSLVLVNASNGTPIQTLSSTGRNEISYSALNGQSFSIRALPDATASGGPKSVKFRITASHVPTVIERKEGASPWALLGNVGSVYTPWNVNLGPEYVVTATGYSGDGQAGKPLTVTIQFRR